MAPPARSGRNSVADLSALHNEERVRVVRAEDAFLGALVLDAKLSCGCYQC